MLNLYLIVVFLLLEPLSIKFFAEIVSTTAEDCYVYHAFSGEKLNISKVHTLGEDLQIGFLRPDTAEPPKNVQIQFQIGKRKVEIYINDESFVHIRKDDENCSSSSTKLAKIHSVPSWYYFILKIHKAKRKKLTRVILSRPEAIRPIASCFLMETRRPISDRFFDVTIHSKHPSHIVLNCLTGCPQFTPSSVGKTYLELSVTESLNLQLKSLEEKKIERESKFQYSLDTYKGVGEAPFNSLINNSIKSGEINIKESREKNMSCVTLGDFKECGDYSKLKILQNDHFNWAIDCYPYFKMDNSMRQGRSLAPKTNSSEDNLTLGQVIAWIISAIALCGVIILAMMLYYNIKSGNSDDGPDHLMPSIMMSEPYDAFPENRSRVQSVSYKEVRRPEESDQPRGSIIDTSSIVTFEHLYPLKVTSEDEISVEDPNNCFASIKSTETVATIVYKEEGGDKS